MTYIGKCVCGRQIYVQNDRPSAVVEDHPLDYEPLVDNVTYTDKPKPRPQPRQQERTYDRLSYTPLLEEAPPQPTKRVGWKTSNDASTTQASPSTKATPTSSKRVGWGVGAGTGETTRHRYTFQKSESSQKMYQPKHPKRTSGSGKKRTGW